MSIILKAENISKKYRLGTVGTGTLSHDLNRWWHQVRGKEDPYLKVGAANDRSAKATEDYVWALRDINFEVKQGEVLGVIGKNGAGKSTLLKILSRVTAPTTGSIKTKGRIASLLEVGTGFHPELTGRENIYLNGAILGMRKSEISAKLDEIVDFSGCEMYIDTPVKRYSSGMRVRLGFAVAAHLEPEILVVDEVLAVGDAEFQKKAIGKMQELSTGEGRTVLFVSHNMVSVQQLCTQCVVLENGKTLFEGTVNKAIGVYLEDKEKLKQQQTKFPLKIKNAVIEEFTIKDGEGKTTSNLLIGSPCNFIIKIKSLTKKCLEVNVRLQFFDEREDLITTLNAHHTHETLEVDKQGLGEMICTVSNLGLAPGDYVLGIKIIDFKTMDVIYKNQFFKSIHINNGDFYNSGKIPNPKNIGRILTQHEWRNRLI